MRKSDRIEFFVNASDGKEKTGEGRKNVLFVSSPVSGGASVVRDAGVAVGAAAVVDLTVAVVVDAVAELGARARLCHRAVDTHTVDAGKKPDDVTGTEPALAPHPDDRRTSAGTARDGGGVSVAILVDSVTGNLHGRKNLADTRRRPSRAPVAGPRSGVTGADALRGHRTRVARERTHLVDEAIAVIVDAVAGLRRREAEDRVALPPVPRGAVEVAGPGALPSSVHAHLADATAVRTGTRVDRRDRLIGRNRGVRDGLLSRVLDARVDRWRRVALRRVVNTVPSVRHAGVVRPRALRAAATDDSARADLPDDRPHRRAVHRIEGRFVERAAEVDTENNHEAKKTATVHSNPPA